ncbi:MAG: metal-sensitive transcriptional regulator [Chloroflexota bacterium]
MEQDVSRRLYNRLRYIEGQAQGLQRMLTEGRPGADVLVQLRALESAATGARELFLRHQIQQEVYDDLRKRLAARGDDALAMLDGVLAEPEPTEKRHRRRRIKEPEILEEE